MTNKTLIGSLIALIFVIGAGYVIYQGRPVMDLPNTAVQTSTTSTISTTSATTTEPTIPSNSTSTPVATPTPAANTFALADIQTHNTPASCWTTIEGNVYDLTTWISRHPGGPGPIQGLCGTDGTARFQGMHGSSRNPRAALVLLKIGTLR